MEDFRPLLVAGAAEPAAGVIRALSAGAEPGAVRDASGRALAEADLAGVGLLVYVLEGNVPGDEDEQSLRLAARKDVDTVCVVVAPAGDRAELDIPHVSTNDLVVAHRGEPFPVPALVERVASRAGNRAYVLAAKLPVLRRAVCAAIVRRFSRQNGILGVAIFVPGADLPALTLNQVRMLFEIAAAYGEEIDRARALELLAVLGAGFGFRSLARQVVAFVPGPGWAVKGGIAYAGTRALGEAAIRYFEARRPRSARASVRSGS